MIRTADFFDIPFSFFPPRATSDRAGRGVHLTNAPPVTIIPSDQTAIRCDVT
jgi:hypothetical protein